VRDRQVPAAPEHRVLQDFHRAGPVQQRRLVQAHGAAEPVRIQGPRDQGQEVRHWLEGIEPPTWPDAFCDAERVVADIGARLHDPVARPQQVIEQPRHHAAPTRHAVPATA
jgi:hypothetical protein